MGYLFPIAYLPGTVAAVTNITNQSAANVAIGSLVGSQTVAQVSTNQVGINQGLLGLRF